MSLFASRNTVRHVQLSLLALAIVVSAPGLLGAEAPSRVLPRITQSINESKVVTLRGNTHPMARPEFDRGPAPLSLNADRMLLVLKRSPEQQADLKAFLTSLQTPGSANYHKYLTPEQFGALYGAADSDVQTVSTWLQGHGFTVNKVNKAKSVVEFSGNVAQLQETFHTSIHTYSVKGVEHFGNASDPQIPAALAPVVSGVSRMNSFMPQPMLVRGQREHYDRTTTTRSPRPLLDNGQSAIAVVPSDAATIYNAPLAGLNRNYTGSTTIDGRGVTIGVVESANIDPNDVANYRHLFGLPASAPGIIVDGPDPGVSDLSQDGGAEAILDVELAGALAPAAQVNMYTAQSNTFAYGGDLASLRAIDDNVVSILSVSYGECEAALGNSGDAFYYALWEQAAAQGISVAVSTGDSGSAGCDDPNTVQVSSYGLNVSGIASTPYNVAVGGTDFDVLQTNFSGYTGSTNSDLGTATRYIPENPWNDSSNNNTTISSNTPYQDGNGNTNIAGAGGGQSACVSQDNYGNCLGGYPKPDWQQVFDNGDGVRDIPDVSLFAADGRRAAAWAICGHYTQSTGTVITDCVPDSSGQFYLYLVGGTSTSTPAFASVLALVSDKTGARLGQANQVLYPLAKQYPSAFNDVTVGNNSVYCDGTTADCGSNGFLAGWQAGTGYDLASGLGSVNITNLINDWGNIRFSASSTTLQLNGGTAPINIVHGTPVNINVRVSGSNGTPGGDVSLRDNLSASANPNTVAFAGPFEDSSFTLSGGSVATSANYLPGGSYSVTAHYAGDGTFSASDSSPVAVTVSPEASSLGFSSAVYDPTSGTALTNFPYGAIAVVDVTPAGVHSSSSANDGIATGTVTLTSGNVVNQTIKLNSEGFVELQTALLPPGTSTIGASYSGDKSFNASSGSANFTVTKGPTSTTATPGTTTVASTSTFALSASIATQSVGALPTGTVTFKLGATTLATTTVAGSVDQTTFLDDATAAATISANLLNSGSNTVTATYSGDTNYAGSSATVSVTVTGSVTHGYQFIPVTPCRVADTRNTTGAFGGPELPAGTTREFDVPLSGCNIPSNAVAYSLNVTVVPSGTLDYLTMWPTGQSQPGVSTLNSLDGRIKANAAITPAGTNGGVDVYVSDATHVIIDIDGYFVPAGTASALAFFPVTPCRIADTRGASGALGGPSIAAGTSRSFPVQSSSCGIPATAQAYSLNVTAAPHTTLDYLTAWGSGSSQPGVSTLNALTGAVTANAAIVPAGTSGAISIYASDATDLILDVNGYFAPAASGGLSLYTVTPCRVLDTRSSSGELNGVLAVGVESSTCAPPSAAQAYVLNATVVPPAPLNYLTLWADGATQPYVSTLNADDGAITSNMAIVPTTNGRVDVFSSNATQVILDLSSYFAP